MDGFRRAHPGRLEKCHRWQHWHYRGPGDDRTLVVAIPSEQHPHRRPIAGHHRVTVHYQPTRGRIQGDIRKARLANPESAPTKRGEFGCNLVQAAPLSRFGAGPMQPLGLGHDLRPHLECDFRPSTLPWVRLRSRAAFSMVFSSCENTMIWRIATRNSSSLSLRSKQAALEMESEPRVVTNG